MKVDKSPDASCGDRSRKNCILAPKIYDQCRFQDCVSLGPVISAEKCECIILHPEFGKDSFGGLVWPGRPVRFPKWVRAIRCKDDSFRLKKITVLSITPSPLKGRWDVSIEFVFDFQLLLFGEHMVPIRILCCPCGIDTSKHPTKYPNDSLACSSSFNLRTTLCGPAEETSFIASDLLPQQDFSTSSTPHVLVQTRAEANAFKLVKPHKADCSKDQPEDAYHEPFRYAYAFVALQADLSLFRFTCLTMDAEQCGPPRECPGPCADPCALFRQIEFPEKEFFPLSD